MLCIQQAKKQPSFWDQRSIGCELVKKSPAPACRPMAGDRYRAGHLAACKRRTFIIQHNRHSSFFCSQKPLRLPTNSVILPSAHPAPGSGLRNNLPASTRPSPAGDLQRLRPRSAPLQRTWPFSNLLASRPLQSGRVGPRKHETIGGEELGRLQMLTPEPSKL